MREMCFHTLGDVGRVAFHCESWAAGFFWFESYVRCIRHPVCLNSRISAAWQAAAPRLEPDYPRMGVWLGMGDRHQRRTAHALRTGIGSKRIPIWTARGDAVFRVDVVDAREHADRSHGRSERDFSLEPVHAT